MWPDEIGRFLTELFSVTDPKTAASLAILGIVIFFGSLFTALTGTYWAICTTFGFTPFWQMEEEGYEEGFYYSR